MRFFVASHLPRPQRAIAPPIRHDDDADAAEATALAAVCAYPCKTMEDVRTEVEFLAKHFTRNDITDDQFDALPHSFLV